MSYEYTILCLANSRKHSGRCIAGKILEGPYQGNWIRPVGTSATREITERDREYVDGTTATVFDIIRIIFDSKHNHTFQSENHIIDDTMYWEKHGNICNIDGFIDNPTSLWENGFNSTSGVNDRVPDSLLTSQRQTLFLIFPEHLSFTVFAEGESYGNPKRVVRAKFMYNGVNYALRVTDPNIESAIKSMNDGEYTHKKQMHLTVSLGDPYNGFSYKLVAAAL